MSFPVSDNSNIMINSNLGEQHYQHLKKYTGFQGRLLGALSVAVKVKGDNNEEYYVKIKDIVKELIGPQTPLTKKSREILTHRILEITDEDTRNPLSEEKLKTLFTRYFNDQAKDPSRLLTEKGIISEIEKLKQEITEIHKLEYSDNLSEIVSSLKPGDFLIRKYHEDHSNIICNIQKFFHSPGYRESYKCSHLALYLGEIDGKHWVAESCMASCTRS